MAEDYVRRSKFFGSSAVNSDSTMSGDTSIFLLGKQTAPENSGDRFPRKQPRRQQPKPKFLGKRKAATPLALAQAEVSPVGESAVASLEKCDGVGQVRRKAIICEQQQNSRRSFLSNVATKNFVLFAICQGTHWLSVAKSRGVLQR